MENPSVYKSLLHDNLRNCNLSFNEGSLRMGGWFHFPLRYLATMFRGEFLTKGPMAPAATDALPVHFRCRTTVKLCRHCATQFCPKSDLTCQILAAKIEQFGLLLLFDPFFGLALEKISHGAWTGLVYGRQRERLLHFVHFDVGSGLGENLRE